MLSTSAHVSRCDGIQRRDALRIGALTALGLGLTDWCQSRARADTSNRRAKACILLWLDGGPSHLETFDLKPDAPAEVRGPFRPIATDVPGIEICELLPETAKLAKHWTLIRSMTSPLGEHGLAHHYLLTGYKPSATLQYPSYGSVLAKLQSGATGWTQDASPANALPANALPANALPANALPANALATGERSSAAVLPPYIAIPETRSAGAGFLGSAYEPFATGGDPASETFRVRDLDFFPELDARRLQRRRHFLQQFDQAQADLERHPPESNPLFEQAYRLVTSPQAKRAFDLSEELAEVRQSYGPRTFGQSCLLARRLIERGVPFVTVTQNGWDTHESIVLQMKLGYSGAQVGVGLVPTFDRGFAALLRDLSERGLLEETLVIAMGEFGRTPKLNPRGGRDHWPRVFSLMLAGAGIPGGTIVGSSDRVGESPQDRPVTPADLARTLYLLLGINPDQELQTPDGRPIPIAQGGKVIDELLG